MKAKDFVKKFGWERSLKVVNGSYGFGAHTYYDFRDNIYYGGINEFRVVVLELKKYTDAYELVRKFGGLNEAKGVCAVKDKCFMGCELQNCSDLEQAIKLVESVDEND